MNRLTFAIIGGDNRSISLYKLMTAREYTVRAYGFSAYKNAAELKQCENLYGAIAGADYVIGPIPCSHNGSTLNASLHGEPIPVDDLFRLIKPGQVFMAGYIRGDLWDMAKKYDVQMVDLLKCEELLSLNAIPTAEGAIKIAIEETDITLHGSRIMVMGYGRVGRVLCKMLSGIGASVTAVEASLDAAALAACMGHEVVMYERIAAALPEAKIIFNTVPKIILDNRLLKHVGQGCVLIDLASPPYGVDYSAAQLYGLKVLYTNSLPGKVAPVSTAAYILDTIEHVVNGKRGQGG